MSGIIKPGPINPPHIQRMMQEGDELAQRLGKLNAFVHEGPSFKGLPAIDAHLLTLQAEVMQSYLHILTIRLARASDEAKGRMSDTATALDKTSGILTSRKPN